MEIASRKHDTLAKLSPEDQKQWLVEHIPHRIRSVLPGLPIQAAEWAVMWNANVESESLVFRCMGNSMWEGRLTSMRWLTMLVGISADKATWKPIRPSVFDVDKDVFITRFTGVPHLFPPGADAEKLALVWAGCSKATAHPTNRTNHPPVNGAELAEAVLIVANYLQQVLYAPLKKSLRDYTLTIKSSKELLKEW